MGDGRHCLKLNNMIVIVDYKMGNIKSLENALNFLGVAYCISHKAQVILNATKIILPGVGTFDMAMHHLRTGNLIETLHKAVLEKHIPILGICLGMQILSEYGEEGAYTKGLGWIKGGVERFSFAQEKLRIPHIGFNTVSFIYKKPNLFDGLQESADYYFVHSYRMLCEDINDISGWAVYGNRFVASVQKNNIFGVQFHPEKSQSNGLTLLKNFISIQC